MDHGKLVLADGTEVRVGDLVGRRTAHGIRLPTVKVTGLAFSYVESGSGSPTYSPVDMVVHVRPADAAANAAPDVWRSMDTAPKDGSTVDLWANGRRTDCRWSASLGYWCRMGGHDRGFSYAVRVDNPTHWMPTPGKPSTLSLPRVGVGQEGI